MGFGYIRSKVEVYKVSKGFESEEAISKRIKKGSSTDVEEPCIWNNNDGLHHFL